jgi:phosphatidylinositol-3-phosphatase
VVKHLSLIRAAFAAFWLVISSGLSSAQISSPVAPPPTSESRPQHVFIIVLENEGFDTTFGKNSPAPYLSRELVSKGELLKQYYAIGHFSLDNYLAMVSGQAPNSYTQNDCPVFYDFSLLSRNLDEQGQALGAGCVYPESVLTIANQLEAKNLTWAGYMEDMESNCDHPQLGKPDHHVQASRTTQYATRHNPFVYFHSIIDHGTCAQHDVPLTRLDTDLKAVGTTPNLAFITPNLCHDGHDGASELCAGGHLVSADLFLPSLVAKILSSPAYLQDGMLIVTFDEADIELKGQQVVAEGTDSSSCCNEPTGPNSRSRQIRTRWRKDWCYDSFAICKAGNRKQLSVQSLCPAQESGGFIRPRSSWIRRSARVESLRWRCIQHQSVPDA